MKNKLIKQMILSFLIVIFLPIIAFADDEVYLEIINVPEYTESYQKWLELPDDEKVNYVEPPIFEEIEANEVEIQTFSANENIVGAPSIPSKYKKDYYGNIKNQGNTNTCWAYSSATAFETNYYFTTSNKKEFSPLHMEYATSKDYNSNGFNRKINFGGNFNVSLAYATNGIGLVTSSNIGNQAITSSLINKIKSTQKVSDYIELKGSSQVKNYIYQYGVVPIYTYFNTKYFSSKSFYNNKDLAYCCTNSSEIPNHAVTIIGWDDNYTNDSFQNKKGAYIALNSYGASFGDNGLYYIFYDDVFANETLYGVTKTNDIDYDYIYQYDTHGCVSEVTMNQSVYAANVFSRKNTESNEQLTEISLYLPSTQSVRVYINANGNDKRISNATKSFTTGVLTKGYHTVKLDSPILLSNNQFSIIVKYSNVLPIERYVDSSSSWCYSVTSNEGESYISDNGSNYVDLQNFLNQKLEIKYSNVCIKAFTKKVSKSSNNSNTTKNTTVNNKNNTNKISYTQNKADLENYLFDYKYYADHNLDLYSVFGYNNKALKNHWNRYGKAEGRKASPIFDAKYYIENNPDLKGLKNNYVEAYNHFVNYGYAEYRKSSAEYDGNFYKSHNGDLENLLSMELIRHYSLYGKNELRQANTNYDIVNYLFDATVYAKLNPDVANAFGNNSDKLREHWYKYGISEGRVASLVFDARSYLKLNSDVARAYSSTNYFAAYSHFINYGFAEGRHGNAIFSAKYYLNNNADLKRAYGNNYLKAMNHFTVCGKNDARLTSAKFNVSKYKEKNRDLSNIFGKNYVLYFEHYLSCGKNENRSCL